MEPILVGPANEIQTQLTARGVSANDGRFEIVDAREMIGMAEEPVSACRAKPRASIMVCAELVASGKAQALVSTGHSGATMVAALWHLKRLPGILRPAIACPIPTPSGTTLLLDGGANTDCKPWHLLQFAMMGSIYAESVLRVTKPTVGILSLGEEDTKGNELVKETIPLLKTSGLDFYGPVEGRDIPGGKVSVVVCDGFVGNTTIKAIEGTAATIFSLIKTEIGSTILSKLGGLLLRGAFARVRKKMSYDEYGGAVLLGVNGTAIISHGRSNGKAVANALRVAKESSLSGVNDKVRHSLERIKQNLEVPL